MWTEWNGQYRDTVRDFWRGVPATLGEFASRITGSSDLYEHSGRKPIASINFITAHDGFTMRDLVSYDDKHNEANGEGGNDGEGHNRSWNHGVEGPTDDPGIRALRLRQLRNFLTTLLLSQGVPMISHGDEIGRTQDGNNNVYCQDNELAWIDWDLDEEQLQLLEFTKAVVRLRHTHPVFKRRRFFAGSAEHGGQSTMGDIYWLQPSGEPMDEFGWDGDALRVAMWLNGGAIHEPDTRGQMITDDDFLVFFNADDDEATFTIPQSQWGERWLTEIDTCADIVDPGWRDAGSQIVVGARAVVVLRSPREPGSHLVGAASPDRQV